MRSRTGRRTRGRRRSHRAAARSSAFHDTRTSSPARGGTASDSPRGAGRRRCPGRRIALPPRRAAVEVVEQKSSASAARLAICSSALGATVRGRSARRSSRLVTHVQRQFAGEEALERRTGAACCAIDSSMLMRSMPSVYSPSRGSGITTSSLILKALVWRAIAAVRARSSQNFLRASADTAMKPSAERHWRCAPLPRRRRHRVLVVADDVADQHHLRPAVALRLGRVADGAHVALVEVFEAGEHRASPALGRLSM
jgi:hypothetical protein